MMAASRPANESTPCVCITSTMSPRAPEPERIFISPTGSAGRKSVFQPSAATPAPMAPIT
ncbi:MAG: hypothetical protein BWX79_02722 [Alphaproteobacteria bacterium ADurb.Bin100]|nr:MAG: hypothetical protein BWX79_02722 [Alphaproteobacteria bacterium ADurb.Bin100]